MLHYCHRPAPVPVVLIVALAIGAAGCTAGGTPVAGLASPSAPAPVAASRTSLAAPSAAAQTTKTVPPAPSATATIMPSPTVRPAPTLTPTVVKGVQDTSVLQDVPVSRVIDGQTIEVKIKGQTYQVRYIGIAAPLEGATPEPLGREATAKNKQIIAGQVVRLEKDVTDQDSEGRLLRYVYTKYTMVNAEMVRLGYARVALQAPDTRYRELFAGMEKEAQDAHRGLWAAAARATATTTPVATRKP